MPVKLFASHLFVFTCFLLAFDLPRLVRFFVLNRPVGGTRFYEPPFVGVRWRRLRLGANLMLLWAFVGAVVMDTVERYAVMHRPAIAGPIRPGVYDVAEYVRYRRGHFRYMADTATQAIFMWRTSVKGDSQPMFDARYETLDSATVGLVGKLGSDSLRALLVRVPRHFQLAERQFHWVSEYHR
jgi:hypothetical protein